MAAGKSTRRQPPPRPARLQRERRLSSFRGALWTNLPAVAPESLAGLCSDVRQAREEYRLGHYEDAERVLARPLRALPAMARGADGDALKAVTTWASAWAVLARTRDKLGHPRQAHAAFERAVGLFDARLADHPDATGEEWLDYGVALEGLGRNNEALSAFERAQTLGLLTSETYRHMGFALLARDPADAERCFRLSKELAPEDPYALRVLAEHLKNDRPDEAQDLFRDAAFASGTKGDIEEALELFDVALELEADDPNALAGKAEMWRVLDECEAALPLFEKSLALTPDVPWVMAGKGAAMHRLGDHTGALEMLDATLLLAADFLFAIGTKGRVLRELGRLEESAALLRTVAVDDPSTAWVLVELGETERLRGNDQGALDVLNRSLDLVPRDPAARAIRAAVHLALGAADKALLDVQRSLELREDSAFAQMVYGQVLYFEGRVQEASAAFERAVTLDPTNHQYLTWLGEGLRVSGALTKAVEAFDAALALKSDFAPALATKGAVLYLLERYEDALAALDEALRLEKNRYPFALTGRGRVLRRLGRLGEAEQSLRDSLALDSVQPLALTELAELVHEYGRADEALELSERALALDEDLVPALVARANALRAMGRHHDAVAPLQKATELAPTEAWTQAVLGDTMLALGDAEQALVHLDNALALEPDQVFALATKGQVLRLQREMPDAIAHLREAIEHASDADNTGWIHTELGEALRASDRHSEALDEFGRALEWDPDNPWALAGRGSVMHALQRYPEALELLERALELARKPFAQTAKAEVLIDIGRYGDAIELLDEVVGAEPPDGWILRLKGWAAELLEEGELALEAYRRALEVERVSPWAERGIAEARLLLNDRQAALAGFRHIIADASSIDSIDPSKMMLVGWAYLRVAQLEDDPAQHYELAIRYLSNALAFEEDVLPVQFDIALAQMSSGQHKRGCQAYRRGIAAAHDLPPLRRWAILEVARNDLRTAGRLVPGLDGLDDAKSTIRALEEAMKESEAEAEQEERKRQNADPDTAPV